MSSAICLDPLVRIRLRRTGILDFVVAFMALVAAVSVGAGPAGARDANAPAASEWCVEHADSGEPPSCIYDNFLTCGVAALTNHGTCKARSSLPASAFEQPVTRAAHPRGSASPRTSARRTTVDRAPDSTGIVTLPAAKREKLFREFVAWRRQHSNQ